MCIIAMMAYVENNRYDGFSNQYGGLNDEKNID